MSLAQGDQENRVVEWLGRSIGGYEIESEIGRGGMSTVYRAYQPQLERWLAIKVMKPASTNDDYFLTSFRREARAIALLRHPNILTVYDYGEEEGMAYIVMEYIDGGTLEKYVPQAPLPWSQLATLIIPIAHALDYAHSNGLIHCDVKPGNVLMARPQWPLLADFGLLRLHEQDASPGILSGTPVYASPEQIRGQQIDQTSDIYSLGLILYQLISGRLPFQQTATSGLMLQRLVEAPIPPSRYVSDLPLGLEEIVLKAVDREPANRFASMASLAAALTAIPGTSVSILDGEPSPLEPSGSTRSLSEHPLTQKPHIIVTGTGTVLSLPQKNKIILGRQITIQDQLQPDVDLGPHGGLQAGVSRRHAKLRHTAEGWLLEDLKSTNGTSLNMAPVEPGKLYCIKSGDVIRCGRLMLVFFEE